jgi:hypothetical protein
MISSHIPGSLLSLGSVKLTRRLTAAMHIEQQSPGENGLNTTARRAQQIARMASMFSHILISQKRREAATSYVHYRSNQCGDVH